MDELMETDKPIVYDAPEQSLQPTPVTSGGQSGMNINILRIFIVITLLLISFGTAVYLLYFRNPSGTQTQCTLEAKQCPDGSSVGRMGPSCQFAACPEALKVTQSTTPIPSNPSEITEWKTYTFKTDNFSIEYPSSWLLLLRSDEDSMRSFADTEQNTFALIEENTDTSAINQYGRIDFSNISKTRETDVEKWFDDRYKTKPGMPVSGMELQKESVIVTPSKLKILRTEPHFALDTVQQYFIITNNTVYTITTYFVSSDTGLGSSENKRLESIYDRMINSVKIVSL